MSSWSTVRVGDIAEQVRGVTYAKDEATLEARSDRIPLLTATNVTSLGLIFEKLIQVPKARVLPKQVLKKGDVVVVTSSGSLSVVGKAFALGEEFNGTFGAFCKVLRPSVRVDKNFFAHYFRTVDYRARVSTLASGANINNLRGEHLDDLIFPLPPLAEQRRIASILDQADALRAKRRVVVTKTQQLAQALFMEAFGDPADNPKGWPVEQLSALVSDGDTINYGVIQPGDDCDDGVPLVRVGDLMGGRVRHQKLKRISKDVEAGYRRSRLKGDEVLVSCVGSIGQVALTTPEEKGFNIARAVARIRVNDRVRRVFIAEYLRTTHVQRYFTSELRTVSQPTLNIKQLGETRVFVPPVAAQEQFCDQIASLGRLRSKLDESEMACEALFASLQHRAFRGEL